MDRYSMQVLWSEEDQCFIATCPELSDASAFGGTPAKAARELEKALALVIETHVEKHWPLPEPEVMTSYSGQLRLRLPKALHAKLATRARREGVSLNTFIVTALSEDIGRRGQAEYFLSQFRDLTKMQFVNLITGSDQHRVPHVASYIGGRDSREVLCGLDGMLVSDGSGNYNASARGVTNG